MTKRLVASSMALSVLSLACESPPDAPEAPVAPADPQGWIPTEEYETPPEYRTELGFFPPPGWVVETPSSGTRKLQCSLPHVDGDEEDAWLVVDYFGPRGNGNLEATLERWKGRFVPPDDGWDGILKRISSSAMGYYKNSIGERHRWCRTFQDVEISGTYLHEVRGSAEREPREDWRMLGTIIEVNEDTGPYYVELVGPADTVAYWSRSYSRFLMDAKPLRDPRAR